MEIFIAFILGLVTTAVVEAAKKFNVSPRILIAGIAGILSCLYLIFLFLMGKSAIEEILQSLFVGFTTWYSTSTFVYEWIIKFVKLKDTPAG